MGDQSTRPEVIKQNEFRVMAMDPVRLVWTVRSRHEDIDTAREHAEALQRSTGLRVRIKPGIVRLIAIKPAVINETKQFREQQLMEQLDLADAKKYYKSPG